MQLSDRRHRRLWIGIAIAALIAPAGLASGILSANPRVQGGDPDGGGILPHATPPSTPPTIDLPSISVPTFGVVLDAHSRHPICGAAVVVTDTTGELVEAAVTDEGGKFLVYLPVATGLELAIPAVGVAGIEVQPGESLLILVP